LAEGSNNYDETNDFFRMKLNGLRRTFRHGFCRTLSAEVNEIGIAKTRAGTDRVRTITRGGAVSLRYTAYPGLPVILGAMIFSPYRAGLFI
jgi:hypothetical protein